MTQELGKIVRISVAVVIALCLLIVAIVGVPWDEGVAKRRADFLSEQRAIHAPPASQSCGDFRIPGPVRYPLVVVEVVQGNVPCRVTRRVIEAEYRGVGAHGVWSCGWPETGFIMECKSRGGQETIRTRFYCRDWGELRDSCLNTFGPP